MILAFETATDVCSVAFRDREGQVYEKRTEQRGSHSEQLFLFTRELMEEREFSVGELKAVLISEGPGSYTGLRIAASAVKGMLYGGTTPLYAVHTLAAFAAGAIGSGESQPGDETTAIHAVIDARRTHLYHRKFRFHDGRLKADGEAGIRPIEEVESEIGTGDRITGSGLERLDPDLRSRVSLFGTESVSARSLLTLRDLPGGEAFIRRADPALFDPRYYSSRQVK